MPFFSSNMVDSLCCWKLNDGANLCSFCHAKSFFFSLSLSVVVDDGNRHFLLLLLPQSLYYFQIECKQENEKIELLGKIFINFTSSLWRLPWIDTSITILIIRGSTLKIIAISVHAFAKHTTQPISNESYIDIHGCNIRDFLYTHLTLPFAEHCIISAWQAKNIPKRIKIFISSLTGLKLDDVVIYAIKHVCHNLIKIVFTSTHTQIRGVRKRYILRDSRIKNWEFELSIVNSFWVNVLKCN